LNSKTILKVMRAILAGIRWFYGRRGVVSGGSFAAVMMAAACWMACSGCMTPGGIARRALEAPNRQNNSDKEFKSFAFATTNFPVQRATVGPPPATLELMVIEPGDYGAKIFSKITPRRPLSKGDTKTNLFTFGFSFAKYPIRPKLQTNDIRGTIFLLHGYSLSKEFMLPWGMTLAQAGYRVVLVDLRGHGHSTGDRIYFGGVERTDMVQCLDELQQRRVCAGPVGVLGVSYGAVLALQWAAVDSRVQTVAAISPYMDPGTAVADFLKTYVPALSSRTDKKASDIVAQRLAAEGPDLNTTAAVRQLKQPVLFVRGGHDELCSAEDLKYLQAAAPPGSEVTEVPLANHLVAGMCISQLSGPVIEWFGRHLTR
jgi:pimeloyl-ACP methyl ester carboxylesterase